jgi:hypothetical protein
MKTISVHLYRKEVLIDWNTTSKNLCFYICINVQYIGHAIVQLYKDQKDILGWTQDLNPDPDVDTQGF